MNPGVTTLLATLVGTSLLALPIAASAFWPFSTVTFAANEGGDPPILHDSSLPLLEAAINSDPNPEKGDSGVLVTEDSALIANSGPDGSLPDSTIGASSASGQITTYTVKDGDSISQIASSFGVSVNTILWANDLTIKSTIKPGMNLVILPVSGIQHKVLSGETLSTVAKKYGGSAQEIATFNGLDVDSGLTVGDTIIIPGGEVASAPSTSSKSSSTKSTKSSSSSVKVKADLGTATGGGYFDNPVPGAYLTQGIHGNNAVDLAAPAGTPIHAAASGTVIVSKGDGAWNGGYGSYVVISHANGTQTLYAHMSKDIATVGETVSQGDLLGYVGETGEATGNHVHFEVRGAKNPFGYSCTLNKKCY